MGGANSVGPAIQGSGWEAGQAAVDSAGMCVAPEESMTPSSQFCPVPQDDKKLLGTPVSLRHPLFTPARPPVVFMTLTPGAEADRLVLEAKIENALARFSNQSFDPSSRAGVTQAALERLQGDLKRSPGRFSVLQHRFEKIMDLSKTWDGLEQLKAAKPELFYQKIPANQGRPETYVPWQEGTNRFDEVQQAFAVALSTDDATIIDQGLVRGNEFMQDLRFMLVLDGARKVLTAASDPNVQSGQVRLLPEYTEASGDFHSPLSTVSLDVLNSSALVKTYQKLKRQDPEEARRVAAAIDYIRLHQEAGLLRSDRAAVVREEVYGHLLTLQKFVALVAEPSYRIDDALRTELVDPAVTRMQRYEDWLHYLDTTAGSQGVQGEEGGLAQLGLAGTLELELATAETRLGGLRHWGERSEWVERIRTGWLGEPTDATDEASRHLHRFFAESLGEPLEVHALPTAQREAVYDWNDATHGADDYERQGGAPYPASGGIPLAREKLRQVAAGQLSGEEATRAIRDALVMLHETEQRTLVMELAARNLQNPSPELGEARLIEAIVRINTAGERTGQAAKEVAKIARGEPVPLPVSTLNRSGLEQELALLNRNLPSIRAEIKAGMSGWNLGEGDVHVSLTSVDLLMGDVGQLRSDLAKATTDEEIVNIKTRYTHLAQTLFQTVQGRLETTRNLHFYRGLIYDGLIMTPIALTGALAGRVLIQAAIAGTSLEGTVLGGTLILAGEAGGMMTTSKLFQGAYQKELDLESPLPYDSIPKNVLHLVEELGLTMGMFKFFHVGQGLVAPFVARTEVTLAVRKLMARGMSELEIMTTREGQALLVDTIKTNLFGKLTATGVRMGTTFGTFTAWDYVTANYQQLKAGEFHPLDTALQVLSPRACLRRAALLPVYELYGRLTSLVEASSLSGPGAEGKTPLAGPEPTRPNGSRVLPSDPQPPPAGSPLEPTRPNGKGGPQPPPVSGPRQDPGPSKTKKSVGASTKPTPVAIPVDTSSLDLGSGVARFSGQSPDPDPVGGADVYADVYRDPTHHEGQLLDHYCGVGNRDALAFRGKLEGEYVPLVQRYHELRNGGDPSTRPKMEAVAQQVIRLYYELEASPFQKDIVERYYQRVKIVGAALGPVTSLLTTMGVRTARSDEPITYGVQYGPSLEGPTSDFVRVDVHVHSPEQAGQVLRGVEGKSGFFDQLGDPLFAKGKGLILNHDQWNGTLQPGANQLVVLTCQIPKDYRALPSPATQKLFGTFRERVKEDLETHPNYRDLARRVDFLDAVQQNASPLVRTNVVDALHELLQAMAKSHDPETLFYEVRRGLDQAIAQYGVTNGMVTPISLTIHVEPVAEPVRQPAAQAIP